MDDPFKEIAVRVNSAIKELTKVKKVIDETASNGGSIDDIKTSLDIKVDQPRLEGPTPLADSPQAAMDEEKNKTITKTNQFEQDIVKRLEKIFNHG